VNFAFQTIFYTTVEGSDQWDHACDRVSWSENGISYAFENA